jgi:hypothetical protein
MQPLLLLLLRRRGHAQDGRLQHDAAKWGWVLLGVAADLQTNEVGVKSEGE